MALVARALTALLAGLAAKVVGSLVNGLMPLRAGRAGFFTTTNFAKPGSTKTPFFFSSLWPISTSASMTFFTPLRVAPSPTLSTTASSRPLLVSCFVVFVFGFAIEKSPVRGLRTDREHRWFVKSSLKQLPSACGDRAERSATRSRGLETRHRAACRRAGTGHGKAPGSLGTVRKLP